MDRCLGKGTPRARKKDTVASRQKVKTAANAADARQPDASKQEKAQNVKKQKSPPSGSASEGQSKDSKKPKVENQGLAWEEASLGKTTTKQTADSTPPAAFLRLWMNRAPPRKSKKQICRARASKLKIKNVKKKLKVKRMAWKKNQTGRKPSNKESYLAMMYLGLPLLKMSLIANPVVRLNRLNL